MKRKTGIVIAVMLLAALLTGCSPLGLDTQTLMQPPKTTGERQEIYQVLAQKTDNQLTLRYPKAGEYRSAIIMRDVTGDGNEEAIAFYTRNDEPFTIISVIRETDGVWQEVASFQNPSTQIDRVCFGDFSGDGILDIAVGWGNSATGLSELYLYAYRDGMVKETPTKELYHELTVLPLDAESGKSAVLTARLKTKDNTAAAKLLELVNDNVHVMGMVQLDPEVTKYSKVTAGKIDADRYGVLLDGTKGANAYQTEILYWDSAQEQLKNPLYLQEEKTVQYTARATAVFSQDINGDGILEVPIGYSLPGVSAGNMNETSYVVNWHRYNVRTNTVTGLLSTIVNSGDGYMFLIPESWKDRVTTTWNEGSRQLTFYRWLISSGDGESGRQGEPLLMLQVMTQESWERQASSTDLVKLKQYEDRVFAARLFDGDGALTAEQAEASLKLLTSN